MIPGVYHAEEECIVLSWRLRRLSTFKLISLHASGEYPNVNVVKRYGFVWNEGSFEGACTRSAKYEKVKAAFILSR